METPPSIFDFNFDVEPANSDRLIQAWMPEIERAILRHETDDRLISFVIAALRIGARSKTLSGFNLMELVEKAGYSRATFFRMFGGSMGFFLKGYQLSARLTLDVYKTHLYEQSRELDEFCKFTADVFYGVHCTIPTEIMQFLWGEHELSQQEFHPHLPELSKIMADYLAQNEPTKHLSVDLEELTDVINGFDLIMLTARISDDPKCGTPETYRRLLRMFRGYFASLSLSILSN